MDRSEIKVNTENMNFLHTSVCNRFYYVKYDHVRHLIDDEFLYETPWSDEREREYKKQSLMKLKTDEPGRYFTYDEKTNTHGDKKLMKFEDCIFYIRMDM